MRALIALLPLVLCASLQAAPLRLQPILDEYACDSSIDGVGELGWKLRLKNPADGEPCVFAQTPEVGDQKPFVRMGGRKIILIPVSTSTSRKSRTPWTDTQAFASPDHQVRVILRFRMEYDSCVVGEDKCCGQKYDGELEVRSGSEKAIYKVSRWSGS